MTKPLLVIGNKNYSSWSLRGWLPLRKAGVDFDERWLPLDTAEFADEIPDLSPTHRVPVLWHEARCIWDSMAIGEYVNDVFVQGRFLPADSGQRAWARSINAEMHAGFTALRNALPMNLRASGRTVARTREIDSDISRIVSLWTECREAHADQGPWLFGAFSLADAMYAPVALRFPTYGIELPPVAAAYQSTVLEDADIKAWTAAALTETERVEADEAGA